MCLLAGLRGRIGKEKVRNAICSVGLNSDEKKTVGKYSLGMRQRLGIAQAIMENPQLLILDEPMNGLDLKGADAIRKLLISMKKPERIIIVASHIQQDIEELCDEVYFMKKVTLESPDLSEN